MSAPHIPRHGPPPTGKALRTGWGAINLAAGIVATVAVCAFAVWLNFGDKHSDYQRLNALEQQVGQLQVLVGHHLVDRERELKSEVADLREVTEKETTPP